MAANRAYSDADFAHPTAVCDIIMKGGITSGVVYPLAITELARRYCFAHIGGTSAGAIAAAAAAAAEYGRKVPGKGFMRLTRLPDEAGQILFSLLDLRMMTTNLMQRRPHTLPFADHVYAFKRGDFARIFPSRIMDYLVTHSRRIEAHAGEFYEFPPASTLPLVVAARLSLSFPVLISAVPLYACDHTLKGDDGKQLRRCLFSDGGLSSNFPIHFFDRMLPNAPTFGISLDEYDRRRDRSPDAARETRVWMPDTAVSGQLLPIQSFDGLVGFFARLIDAAKDWQDNLQGTLAGYRDRIVHVYLKPEEGGLNIVMPHDRVATLGQHGAEAGDMLQTVFDLDEHRWRRFLVAMGRLDQTMADFAQAYGGLPPGPESFGAFLSRYPPRARSYKQSPDDLALLLARAADVAALGQAWSKQPGIADARLPHPKTDLRITPKP